MTSIKIYFAYFVAEQPVTLYIYDYILMFLWIVCLLYTWYSNVWNSQNNLFGILCQWQMCRF